MKILHGRAEIERGLTLPLASEMHNLIAARLGQLTGGAHDLSDATVIAIFEAGDRDADLRSALGWGLLINPYDSAEYPSPDYQPWADYVHWATPSIAEAIVTVGNDGWAVHVLIPTTETIAADLRAWVRLYANHPDGDSGARATL